MPETPIILLGYTTEIYDVLLHKSFATLGRYGKPRVKFRTLFIHVFEHGYKIVKTDKKPNT